MRSGNRHYGVGLLAVLVVAGAIVGAGPADPDRPVNPLSTKQQMIRDRVARWKELLFRTREKLAQSEPENARRAAAALERAGQREIDRRLDDLIAALDRGSDLQAALEEQQRLESDIAALLEVLLDNRPDDAAERQEAQRLAEVKRGLDEILARQRELRRQAADAVQGRRAAAQLEALQQRLDQLLDRQQQLAERTAKTPASDAAATQPAAELGAEQTQAAAETRQLAEDVARLNRAPGQPSAPNGKTETRPATDGRSGDSAESDRSADAERDLNEAAERMDRAAKEIDAGRMSPASAQQKEALDRLQRARHRLEELRQELDDRPRQGSGGDEQRDTADQTGRLAQRMQQPEGAPPDGKQPEGEGQDTPADRPKNDTLPATPGQDNVQRAERAMRQAADRLDRSETEPAIEQQDQALSELEQAQRQLEDTLRQMRKEDQEEALRSLESRLQEMVSRQTVINSETVALQQLGADNFGRAEVLRAVELADRQAELAQAAGAGVRLLEEDGTTVVFPRIMQQLAGDMDAVAGQLRDRRIGPLTVASQNDILVTLKELLESFHRAKEKLKQSQGMPPSGNAMFVDPPLVPASAELKVLRSTQLRVNRQTTEVETARSARELPADEAEAALRRAAEVQAELGRLARQMQERAKAGGGP